LTTQRKIKIGLGVAVTVILVVIIGLSFFVKPAFEYGFRRAGFANARIETANFSLSGTTLKNVRLDDTGSEVGEIRLFATLQDVLAGHLSKVEIADAKIQWPMQGAAAGKVAGAFNIFTKNLELINALATVRTPAGDLPLTLSGSVVDRGDKYQANLDVGGAADFAKLSGKLTGDVLKENGAARLHFELAEAKVTQPAFEMKRVTGFVDVDIDPAKSFPQPNAQLDFGALTLFKSEENPNGLPLQGAKVIASATQDKIQFTIQARVPNESGDIDADLIIDQKDPAADRIYLKAEASLKKLDELGLTNLKGRGNLLVALNGTRAKTESIADLTRWQSLEGSAGIAMNKLSLPGLLKDAEAIATVRLSLDPEKQIIAARAVDGPMSFSGVFRPIDLAPVFLSIPANQTNPPVIVWDQVNRTLETGFDNASFTGFGVQAKQLTANVKAYLDGAPAFEGKLNVDELSHMAVPQQKFFIPVRVALRLQRGNPLTMTQVFGEITEKNGKLSAVITGKHDAAANVGDLQVNMPPVTMAKNVTTLSDLFPVSQGFVGDAYGTIGFSGDIAWGRSKKGWATASRGKLYLRDFTCTVKGNVISGVSTVMDLDSLSPLVITKQQVAVRALNVTLPLTNGVAVISLAKDKQLSVHSANWEFAQGKVAASPFTMNLGDMSTDVTLTATNLSVPELFKVAPTEGLMATGTVNGTLPLQIRNGEMTVVNGQLETTGPGTIRYDQNKLPAFLQNAAQQSIVDLKNLLTQFNYDSLGMTIDGTLGQSQKMVLHIKGKNPLFYSGRPVDFNLNLEGPLGNVLKYNPGGSQIPDSIKQQLEAYEASHAKL
jgi:hypothetical protein